MTKQNETKTEAQAIKAWDDGAIKLAQDEIIYWRDRALAAEQKLQDIQESKTQG